MISPADYDILKNVRVEQGGGGGFFTVFLFLILVAFFVFMVYKYQKVENNERE